MKKTIKVIDNRNSKQEEHVLELTKGMSLYDMMDDAGLKIRADCGGNCCCSTCHVYIIHPDKNIEDEMSFKSFDEISMLEEATSKVLYNSKLCCMMEVEDKMDGMVVILTEDTKEIR